MSINADQERQQAHLYLDRLPPNQITAVRSLLEAMLDPVALALIHAPDEDELITQSEEDAVAEARRSVKEHNSIPFEQAVAELGFTMDEVRNSEETH